MTPEQGDQFREQVEQFLVKMKKITDEIAERVATALPRLEKLAADLTAFADQISQPCPVCEGEGYVWDPTACGDPDHCHSHMACPTCKGIGKVSRSATEPLEDPDTDARTPASTETKGEPS